MEHQGVSMLPPAVGGVARFTPHKDARGVAEVNGQSVRLLVLNFWMNGCSADPSEMVAAR